MSEVKFLLGAYFGKEPTFENLKEFYEKNIEVWERTCKIYRSRDNVANKRKFQNALKELIKSKEVKHETNKSTIKRTIGCSK